MAGLSMGLTGVTGASAALCICCEGSISVALSGAYMELAALTVEGVEISHTASWFEAGLERGADLGSDFRCSHASKVPRFILHYYIARLNQHEKW